MNKKQLTLQNSSLFAELERRAKDSEILNIRLEEAEQKINELMAENEALKNSLERADDENKKLFEKNKELENALAEAAANAVKTHEAFVAEEIEMPTEDENDTAPTYLEISEKINEPPEQTEVAEENEPSSPTIEPDFENATHENIVTETLTPPTTFATENSEKSQATADLLRDYGAKIIGKVTRVTAEVLSKVGSLNTDATESLKTLALGKNESFKYQIIELAKAKGDPDRIMGEMDFLADEAIVYLRSI